MYREIMPGLKELSNVWNNVKEVDLRPIAEAAQRPLHLALVGRHAAGLSALADSLRRDPARPDQVTHTPVLLANPDELASPSKADLAILLVDLAAGDPVKERALTQSWSNHGVPVLVILLPQTIAVGSEFIPPVGSEFIPPQVEIIPPRDLAPGFPASQVLAGDPDNPAFLIGELVPTVLRLLPEQGPALARQFPLFRQAVAKALISDTCFSNAAYALSTGLAEIVPVFNVPLNITDMVVLTKAQAFLVYRLGLALGLSTRWQDYVAEFGSVLGGGFLWRQVARSLIGLIPAWGIIPKVAVAYSGTYVVGNVVHQWYLTGRHLSGRQMRQLYTQAFARGKHLAQNMAARLPKSKRKPKQLKPGEATQAGAAADIQPSTLNLQPKEASARRPLLSRKVKAKACPNCGKTSAKDAQFCQYCGQALN